MLKIQNQLSSNVLPYTLTRYNLSYSLCSHMVRCVFVDNAKLSFYATSKKLAECKALFNNVLSNVFPGFKPKAW